MLSFELSLSVNEVRDMFAIFVGQNAGEESVANIDKLRHANGSQSTADIRLKMQKVNSCLSSSHQFEILMFNLAWKSTCNLQRTRVKMLINDICC